MLVFEGSQHLARIGIAVGVQRDEQRFARNEALEAVHPVGDANVGRPVLAGMAEIVPARPDTAALGHQLRILVKHGGVSRVLKRAQPLLFLVARVREHGERLVGMGGDDNVVVGAGLAVFILRRHCF